MRRRARETFVLGAERVFDEAELDLRNEAEADHDPTTEADRTAPAETAIDANPPAGLPVGAEIHRASSSGSDHGSRRPRPPVRAVAIGAVATVAAALAVLLYRADDPAPTTAGAVALADRGTSQPARPAHERSTTRPIERAGKDRGREGAGRIIGSEHATGPNRDASSVAPATAAPATPESVSVSEAPVPEAPSAEPAAHEPAVAVTTEPLQSAASVRQEFGP